MRRQVETGDWPSDKDFKWVRGLITEDGQVSKAEAEALFLMKTMAAGKQITPAFADLFVQGVTSFLLFTGVTQGSLDDREWIWLSDHISADGNYDELEQALADEGVASAKYSAAVNGVREKIALIGVRAAELSVAQ